MSFRVDYFIFTVNYFLVAQCIFLKKTGSTEGQSNNSVGNDRGMFQVQWGRGGGV